MIIITGASKGIGRFLFESYLNNNEVVLGTYFNSKPKNELINYFHLDVSNFNQVESFVKEYEDKLESLTLINCAGITYNSFTHKCVPEKWREVIDINLFGSFNMVRALLPIMRAQKFGRIINFSSVVAVKPTPGVSSYATSKSALWGFAKSVAIENAALNITVNCINLGYTKLGMIEEVPEDFRKTIVSQIPAGKLCEPKDILNTVEFLRSTSYITGSAIDLSGGLV